MKLDKTFKALRHFASKDQSRPVLTGIYFDSEKAVATDGLKVMTLKYPDQEGQTPLVEKVILGMTNVVNAVKRLGNIPFDMVRAHQDEIDSNVVNLLGVDSKSNAFMEVARKIDGSYPQYSLFIGAAQDREAKAITFVDVNLMLQTFQGLKEAGVREARIKVAEPLDSIQIRGMNMNGLVEVVLMPTRVDEDVETKLKTL